MPGAKDLESRYVETQCWFSGQPIYGLLQTAEYPPASYILLWPFLGWLAFGQVRWLWAATTLMALAWLAYLCVRESQASTRLQRLFIVFTVLSIYPTGNTITVGQLGIHCLAMLVTGLLLLYRGLGRWWEDLLGSALFVAALVKPSTAAPFIWMVLFIPGRLRPFLLVSLGYAALTLIAASFEESSLPTLLQAWLAQRNAVIVEGGYANFHKWMAAAGLKQWMLSAALFTLLALGLWTWRYRRADVWLLLGVTALVARFWTYHRMYDDQLILVPMIALFRLVRHGARPDGSDVTAGLLLAVNWAAMLTPVRTLQVQAQYPGIFGPLYLAAEAGHSIVWLAVLAFLLREAWQERNRSGAIAISPGIS